MKTSKLLGCACALMFVPGLVAQARFAYQANQDGSVGVSSTARAHRGPVGPSSGPAASTCVSQNPSGGTLTSSISTPNAWFAHRVTAPADLRIQSFDFFGKTGGVETIQTRIYSSSGGKPGAVLRSSSMQMTPTPGFYRSNVSELNIANGTVFFIAYRTPNNSNFRSEITSGTIGTYYWGDPDPVNGPFNKRFAWRIVCTTPGSFTEYGWGSEGRGAGSGTYAAGENTDATASGATSWLPDKQFVHRIVAPRDMNVSGASFLSRMATASAALQTYMYLADAGGKPVAAPVRTGSMVVRTSSTSRWHHTGWDPVAVSRGQVFFVGYKTPATGSDLRIDTADGETTTYYWNGPTWIGPITSFKFGIRVHTSPAGGENQFATSNATTGIQAGSQFVHRYVATSDMWLGGFSFLASRPSGSASMSTYVYRADPATGKPGVMPSRVATMSVATVPSHNMTTFTPIFLAKDEVFYVGFKALSDLHAVASSGVSTTYYWDGPPTWKGPFSSLPWSFRLDSYRAANNAASTTVDTGITPTSGKQFVHRITVPSDLWVTGFSLLSRMTAGTGNLTAYLYMDAGGKPSAYATRSGRLVVGSASEWNETHFEPLFLSQGTVIYCGYLQIDGFRPALTSGANTTYFWNEPSNWYGPINSYKFGLKLLGHGASAGRLSHDELPELGKTFELKLVGAKPSSIFGVIFGTTQLAIPIFGGHLWTDPGLILSGAVDATGNVTIPLPIPNNASLYGGVFFSQFFVIEGVSPISLRLTNAGWGRIGG